MASKSLRALTQEQVRSAFDYTPETGRLVRVARGRGARVGVEVGSVDELNGHRRAYFGGGNRMTAHLVWLWHSGEMPAGILRHANGVNSDDRIDNLQLLKKQLPVAYVRSGVEVSEYGRLPTHITSGIYEIVCTANGRRYVGSAVSLSARWRLHYTQLCAGKHHSRHLQRAWEKYGDAAFVFRVLDTCEKQELITREQEEIDRLCPEFNSRPLADSQLGIKFSPEARANMSAANNRRGNPGYVHTPEAKARISANRKGKGGGPMSEDRRSKISAANKGRIITPEQRQKISASLEGHKQSASQIEKRKASMPPGHYERSALAKRKLTESQVREVRTLLSGGVPHRQIGATFGVSHSVIADISCGRRYGGVL